MAFKARKIADMYKLIMSRIFLVILLYRLTVTDSDGAKNSTFANVTVIKGTQTIVINSVQVLIVFLITN